MLILLFLLRLLVILFLLLILLLLFLGRRSTVEPMGSTYGSGRWPQGIGIVGGRR